jgi:hypothetical protein
VDPAPLATKLAGKPLSDVAFVIREGARLAARAGENQLSQEYLFSATESAPLITDEAPNRRIGFV